MRVRLAFPSLLAVALAATGDVPRLVWSGPQVNLLGGISRDGRLLSYVDPSTRQLALREIASGQSRLLTAQPAGSGEFAYFSAIAPDSRHVAYAWFNSDGFYELRTIGADGSDPRVLYRNEEAGFVQPCAWSSDSRLILTLLFRSDNTSQIVLIPAAGGPPKVLRTLNWVYPKRMDLSPDGRFIVYDSFSSDSSPDRTIYLLAVDGAREQKLVTAAGNHLFPFWTPDGRSIIYASDRSGTMDAWQLAIENGEPKGEAHLLRRDLGRFLPLGISASADLYYGVRSGNVDVFVTTLTAPTKDAKRVTIRFPNRNSSPVFSPDGKSLAYLSRRGSENFGQESRAIVIRALDSDSERELLPKLAHIEQVRWSPDSSALLASGSDNKGRGGIYRVDPLTAALTPVIAESGAPFRGFDAVWSKDGAGVFYLHGDELRARTLASGKEAVLLKTTGLHLLARSPDGKTLAAGVAGNAIVLVPASGGEPRSLPFPNLTELEWGRELIAARGPGLWRIPTAGETPVKLNAPGNREPGFSLHPDGITLALTAGNAKSEVWMLPLAAR